MRRTILLTSLILMLVAFGTAFASSASADTIGPITFEPSQGYVTGDINGQQQWTKLNPLFDVKVALVSSYPAAAGYGFGTQTLRMSDFFTSGSFGDQTFSPGLTQPAGEASGLHNHFDSTFMFGSALAAYQPGMHVSVSPDNGSGARMSYLRFDDMSDGVHVFFDDVDNPGPIGTESNFVETDIATLSRTSAHSIRFSIDFKTGPGNDVVKIYIDGVLKITGTTWENYYRYDPEAAGNAFQVPPVTKMLFRESGDANTSDLNNGFLVDGLSLSSTSPPMSKDECKNGGWATFTDPSFKNQGDCISYVNNGK
jgi:hypothetical protein